jgi:hypothetical protein
LQLQLLLLHLLLLELDLHVCGLASGHAPHGAA